MTLRTRLLPIIVFAAALGLCGASVSAQPLDSEEAMASFKRGRGLIEQRSFEAAIVELQRSNDRMPSPNTLLLIAHANRELGRLVAAARLYDQVIQEAGVRVKAGEARFQRTGDDAAAWLARIAKELGQVTVTIMNASPDVVVRVNGMMVSLVQGEGGVMRAEKVWVQPGAVSVTVDRPGVASRKFAFDVPRGGPASVAVDFSGGVIVSEQSPSAGREVQRSARVPAGAWVAGGVGIAGFAAFGVFGAMTRSKADELERCSPNCLASQRSVADAGKRDQLFANLGLAVGGLGLATAAGIYFFRPKAQPAEPSVAMTVSPGGISLIGTFR